MSNKRETREENPYELLDRRYRELKEAKRKVKEKFKRYFRLSGNKYGDNEGEGNS